MEDNQTIKDAFLDLIMQGESISAICRRPEMPGRNTIHRWLRRDKKFLREYRNATWVRGRELLEESLAIADRDKATVKDVAADRLRISTRLKLAAVLNPGLSPRKKASAPKKQENVRIHIIDHGSEENCESSEQFKKGANTR
jgi:hypothetical protein